jgi:hypothetical protein
MQRIKFALLLATFHVACALPDACYGTGTRPVLMIPGFQGSPLYNSEKDYKLEWPDIDAFGTPYGPGETDLDLPMDWVGLVQAPDPVVPERSPNEEYPGLDGLVGNIFEFAVRLHISHCVLSFLNE